MNNDNAMLRRERSLLVLLGLICVGLVAGALYLQYFKHEDPCPLCIIQRYFFLLIAIFAFLGARFNSWRGVRLLEVMAALSALAGIVTAARHVYVQANPGFSCGFDALQPVVDSLPPAHWLPGVFKVAGLCETAYPPILGLTLPMWALVGFVLAFVALALSLVRNRRRAS
ncbi:disulfide bond formation protein B [bacterium M00.F.Ca.ET.228.01.1.1]|uniref:Disulfide bond formation protein B n=1 Tax=Burkholderia sp. (strain CCGE1003) TaxID=640512 RepID=E1T6D2_BURSG|nr:disulfide bond formation protein B [Paraburkholderia phenoliruptrix]MBW9128750.1 disulfide bond formation protein B [Paraburkholderia ginsengiterrae]TGP43874.1 disulfide bond formation protein B [bacterium M00.F.Ca.ET.228.01.1.1]TGS01537.1 disulfide bond formation protein B [bacterium M00.F.Ca.ET.191.01.1.1]TGU08857.1 disulfide bond formation protein B [bacterium M00.F.Ca.ET.155.01.1.1]MBW9103630.1 disulfide bond formation protein B [Paraburkholderia phenoliruptrix]